MSWASGGPDTPQRNWKNTKKACKEIGNFYDQLNLALINVKNCTAFKALIFSGKYILMLWFPAASLTDGVFNCKTCRIRNHSPCVRVHMLMMNWNYKLTFWHRNCHKTQILDPCKRWQIMFWKFRQKKRRVRGRTKLMKFMVQKLCHRDTHGVIVDLKILTTLHWNIEWVYYGTTTDQSFTIKMSSNNTTQSFFRSSKNIREHKNIRISIFNQKKNYKEL